MAKKAAVQAEEVTGVVDDQTAKAEAPTPQPTPVAETAPTKSPREVVVAAIGAAFALAEQLSTTSGREIACVKTKLDEAAMWMNRVH